MNAFSKVGISPHGDGILRRSDRPVVDEPAHHRPLWTEVPADPWPSSAADGRRWKRGGDDGLDESFALKRNRLEREMAKLELEEAGQQQHRAKKEGAAEANRMPGKCAPPSEEWQKSGGDRVVVLDEIGSLCEECRAAEEEEEEEATQGKRKAKERKWKAEEGEMKAEERKWKAEGKRKAEEGKMKQLAGIEGRGRRRAADDEELGQRLSAHVNEMNRAEIVRHKRREQEEREEWAMALEEARQREKRIEAERKRGEEEKRRKAMIEEEERGRRGRKELAEAEEGKRKKEEARRWAEDGRGRAEMVERDPGRAARLAEQLRRNEALKRSIERLEEFKLRQKEEAEARGMARQRELSSKRHAPLVHHRSSSPVSADRGRRKRDFSVHPKVFEAWKEAHEANERRYRILQDTEEGREDTWPEMETVIERKRCRKCRKPIRESSYVRYAHAS